MSDSSHQQPPPDWREMPNAERDQRHHAVWKHGGPWIGGLILIALGVVFLLRNFGYPVPDNWWAMFILIPAFAAFGGAWQAYQKDGRASGSVIAGSLGGIVLLGLALALFFNVDFGRYWPIILILLGLVVISGIWRRGNGGGDRS